ncbi:MAG: MFS transporter [Rhodobacteraceae bacterium]|nr:MFS transporter [Paracoccaceae bacterium]
MCVSVSFMTYAGALPAITAAWHMSAAQAGFVQSTFNAAYALSLVATGWLSDQLGAKRIFLWSSWLTAIAGLLVAAFARSFESGLILFALLGLFQGGTYTPPMMLIAHGVGPGRRGLAIGLFLSGASLGYAGSIALSSTLSALVSYHAAFLLCGSVPTLAALAAWIGTRSVPSASYGSHGPALVRSRPKNRRASVLLTLGYTAHCWELLGMWAWMPAFLIASLAASKASGVLAQGLWIGLAIHISGCISAFTMGHASDRLGRRAVLVTLGLMGAICSMAIGWLGQAPSIVVLCLAAAYGFSALGDSPVLSTAITETVEPHVLGTALAVRSILGFGAGGLAPLAFGVAKDFAPGGLGWVVGFSCLGVGGLLAAACALLLPRGRPDEEPTGAVRYPREAKQ